jgi:uncharacterized membrane protein YqjE
MSDYKKIFHFLKLDNIIDHISELIEAKIELYKIELKLEATRFGALFITFMILSFLIFMALLFLSFTLATYLNTVLESRYWGHAIVTAFYLLVFGLLLLLNIYEKIRRRLEKLLVEKNESGITKAELDE